MSADEQGYNGWKNYETWAVGMYLDGNYTGAGTYEAILDLARDEVERGDQANAHSLAARIKDYVECWETDEIANGIVADLLNAALSEVDWHELATHKIAEVSE